MLIRISSPAYVFCDDADVSDPAVLSSLNGIVYDDERFTDYLDGAAGVTDVALLLEEGGYLRFEYDAKETKLTAITEYRASRSLTVQELEILVNYTFGQWSDGIGENFVGVSRDRYGYSIQCETDDPTVEQIDDGVPCAGNRGAQLFRAISAGDLDAIAKALENGADPDARLAGCTAIGWAIFRQPGNASLRDIVELLVDGGANVNATCVGSDLNGICASIYELSDVNATRVAKVLLEQGAKVSESAIFIAADRDKRELRDYLASQVTR